MTLNNSARSRSAFPARKPQVALPIKVVFPAQRFGGHAEGFVSSHLSQHWLCVTAASTLMQRRRQNVLQLQFPALQIHHQNKALQIWSCYQLLLLVIEGVSQKAVGMLHYPRIRTDGCDSNIPLSNFQSGIVPLKLHAGKKDLRVARHPQPETILRFNTYSFCRNADCL